MIKKIKLGSFKYLCLSIIFSSTAIQNSFSQAIINSESLMTDDMGSWSLNQSVEGNYTSGNINLVQFSAAQQTAYKSEKNMYRLFFNYDFLSEDSNVISSDYAGQFRFIHNLKSKNSYYAFTQIQRVKSLLMQGRFLLGGGYRFKIINTSKVTFDFATGPFYELEHYVDNIKIENLRLSTNLFNTISFNEHLNFTSAFYFQVNTSTVKDYRVFWEPKIEYTLKQFSFFLKGRFRYHSTPYVPVETLDTTTSLGFSYKISAEKEVK